MTILCLASYEKGHDFLLEAKRQGWRVLLLTSLSLKDKACWPTESIDDIFYMPDENHSWDRHDAIKSVSYLVRSQRIDRIVALDDFDVELAATLREHLRLPGIGESQARLFRDKLAMRMKAREAGIRVPEFVGILNHGDIQEFLERVPAPWVLKPRSLAGAIGIKKIYSASELWPRLEELGDMQSHYLLEQFVRGDVFHVDTLVHGGAFVFAASSQYGRPPMEVSHGGGIFTTRTLDPESDIAQELLAANRHLLTTFGLTCGVSHSEFIRGYHDDQIYFLETSARVGGAHIADLVQAATGINPWTEWAKIETAVRAGEYRAPKSEQKFAGLLVSLAKEEYPDTSAYADAEVVWRMRKAHHVGLIVKSESQHRIEELLNTYSGRLEQDFNAVLPALEKPTA